METEPRNNMNTPSPLVPQGTFPDSRGKSQIRLAVFTILALHGVLLSTLLIFGCKKAPDQTASADGGGILTPTNTDIFAPPPPPMPLTPTVVGETATPAPAPTTSTVADTHAAATPVTSLPAATTSPPPALDAQREHVVLRGESFYVLAKKYSVSMKAIADANPGVDSARLKIGQKLVIPAPTPANSIETTANGVQLTSSGEKMHVVKAGENLTVIARRHGVKVSDIQTANSLRTTQIRVGQKLRIPSGGTPDAIPPLTPASAGAPGTASAVPQ